MERGTMDARTVGLNPGLSVSSDQRLEKLREQHAEDTEKDIKEEDI